MRRLAACVVVLCAVRAIAGTSACTGTFSVTRTERGTARVHYEDSYTGNTPVFGVPAVTDISRGTTWDSPNSSWPVFRIVQPVVDTGKLVPGSGSVICHAEELDIGTPEEGYNELQWVDQVFVNGASAGFVTTVNPVGFWWHDGSMQCSTLLRAISPSVVIEGQPVHLALIAARADEAEVKTTVDGRTITLDRVPHPTPGPYVPFPFRCNAYDAIVKGLPANDYTVIWRGFSQGISEVITSSFTVVKPTRQRGARH